MLLTISITRPPATDLGFLLHKHPERVQSFKHAVGRVHVFYPEATEERCTAALLLDVDPIGLVRRGPSSLAQYVNDRPYVASSHMSVAIGKVYGSALNGRCDHRPELVDEALPLEARVAVLPCRGGEELLRKLFEPLGWTIEAEQHPLVGEDRPSRYFTVELQGEKRLADLLNHLAVLIPVLDDEKHYWVGDDEIEKLMRRGEGWLSDHPERELISRRYLKHRRALVVEAMTRILEESAEAPDPDEGPEPEEVQEQKVALNQQRLHAVTEALKDAGCRTVVDLGCGEGRLLALLRRESQFTQLLGVDVSPQVLDWAAARLRLEQVHGDRLRLIHGSVLYRDQRLAGFDGAALVEVIEHVEPNRLRDLQASVFQHARPSHVVVTTPNADYNVNYENLATGKFRHSDHRFEWNRHEFSVWTERVASDHGYTVAIIGIGEAHPELGSPTQMAVFSRSDLREGDGHE